VAIEVPGVEKGEETLTQCVHAWRARSAAAEAGGFRERLMGEKSVNVPKTTTGAEARMIPCALRGPEGSALPRKCEHSEFSRSL